MTGPSLTLQLGQRLCITPQLRQAIALLPLSALDLRLRIEHMLEHNPFLECIEEPRERLSDHAPVSKSNTPWEGIADTEQSLHSYLEWQLTLSTLSSKDYAIGLAIIGNLNESGYLDCSEKELSDCLLSEYPHIHDNDIERVRKMIQHFDPPGVASWNIADCLAVQCESRFSQHPHYNLIRTLIRDYLKWIAKKDFLWLEKNLKVNPKILQEAIAALQQLDPRPGLRIGERRNEYLAPDVMVHFENGKWVVQLNHDWFPQIQIQQQTAALLARVKTTEERQYVRHHEQEARWFLKSLAMRHQTLLKVSEAIVARQREFLSHGASAIQPLLLDDIAQEVGLHLSTVSRVTQNKALSCSQGNYELKYFFSRGIAQKGKQPISTTAIRELIKQWINEENPEYPLNDGQLTELLSKRGICVVRRTVAKYRDSLGISAAHERKK